MNSKRLKVSPKNAQRIIDTVLSDDKLVQYVISLVSRRLTAEMQSDADWCNTVIDLSIDQVLNQVDVFEILKQLNETPQIKKSSHKNRENNNTDNNESFRPTFSSTEPKSVVSSSPRRVVKQLNKKKPIDLDDDNERSPPRGRIPAPVNYSRSMSVESDASTIPVVTQANSDGAVISKHLRSEQRDDWLAGVTAETRSESSISSAYEEEDMFAPSAAPSEANTSALQEDTDDRDNTSEDSPAPRDPRTMRTAAAASDALHVTLVKSGAHQRADLSADNGKSLFNSTVILNSMKPESPGESAVLENDDFLSSWERKVLQGMRSGEESSDERGDRAGGDRDGGDRDGGDREDDRGDSGSEELHVAPNKVSISKSSDRVELHDDGAAQEVEEEEYSCDSSVSDDAPDYLSAPQLQSAGSAGGEKVLFFDQSRFDADADFFGSGESEGSPNRSKGKRRQSRPAEASLRRVRFAPQLISEVRFRDRVGYAEKDELFFTHNEEYQFMLDQTKETERAEALGMTWLEWMEERTDEEVRREEEMEAEALGSFKLFSGEYYEEGESDRSSSLEVDESFSSQPQPQPVSPQTAEAIAAIVHVPANDHDFKSANAHAPLTLHHHGGKAAGGLIHRTESTGSEGSAGSGGGAARTGLAVSGSGKGVAGKGDELSVPSCSEEEYDDDF